MNTEFRINCTRVYDDWRACNNRSSSATRSRKTPSRSLLSVIEKQQQRDHGISDEDETEFRCYAMRVLARTGVGEQMSCTLPIPTPGSSTLEIVEAPGHAAEHRAQNDGDSGVSVLPTVLLQNLSYSMLKLKLKFRSLPPTCLSSYRIFLISAMPNLK